MIYSGVARITLQVYVEIEAPDKETAIKIAQPNICEQVEEGNYLPVDSIIWEQDLEESEETP